MMSVGAAPFGGADVAVIIPFRDRGRDRYRRRNLDRVVAFWGVFGRQPYEYNVIVAEDGRCGDAQFNRSAAYNRGTAQTGRNLLVYAEADVLPDHKAVAAGVALAMQHPGLVVPYTELYRLGPEHFGPRPPILDRLEETNNYGCINILHRDTLTAAGQWDETFDGNAHDDAAMWMAFEKTSGPARFVEGPALHLYHRESIRPDATVEDKAATERNYRRMQLYAQARTAEEVRHLTAGGQTLQRDWRGQLR